MAFAADAGKLALALRADGLDISHKGDGLGQALIQADVAISRMLHDRFGHRVIEEETAESIGREVGKRMLSGSDWTFVADPIDGTKPYSGGLSGWGTMIAACRNGRPESSVLILPAWSEARHDPDGQIHQSPSSGSCLQPTRARRFGRLRLAAVSRLHCLKSLYLTGERTMLVGCVSRRNATRSTSNVASFLGAKAPQ